MHVDLNTIRQLREERGLSQAQVASSLGYKSAVAYCRLESGARRIRIEHLAPLAAALGVTVAGLLTTESAETVAACRIGSTKTQAGSSNG